MLVFYFFNDITLLGALIIV